jgi:RimJ/RimL family protein N-acetyltransferase
LVLQLLEGGNVNLRIAEKEDWSLLSEWVNDPEVFGLHNPLMQLSKAELEGWFDTLSTEGKLFLIEKKDGSKIGEIYHMKDMEIGFGIVPSEGGKGYCTEAVKIIVDYMFLSKNIIRIYALPNVNNLASNKVLEKAGFKKDGIIRKSAFIRGEWTDRYLYSILRDEWKEPKILTRTEKK